MKPLVVLMAASVLLACGPGSGDGTATAGSSSTSAAATSTSTDTTSTDSTSTGSTGSTTGDPTTGDPTTLDPTTGDPVPEACSCYGDCGPSLCPGVFVTCESYCGDSPQILNDEAALQCALEALRDRTPGRLSWSESENGGQFGESVGLSILADGTAVRKQSGAADLCSSTGPDTHSTLKDPSYFEGCLAEPEPLARFACMRAALLDTVAQCAPYDSSCDDF